MYIYIYIFNYFHVAYMLHFYVHFSFVCGGNWPKTFLPDRACFRRDRQFDQILIQSSLLKCLNRDWDVTMDRPF